MRRQVTATQKDKDGDILGLAIVEKAGLQDLRLTQYKI